MVTLRLYDTLSRQKRDFGPVDPSHVRMYVCGPTVYDFAHIGNARPVVVFDVLYRLLKRLYPPPKSKVTYARNITDVDDKIIAASKETGEPIEAITRRFADQYRADMAALGALPPDIEPRATGHIAQMIAMIEKLIETGNAYEAGGHVLFNVPSMADYGRLSRHNRDELIAGARVEVAPYKRDPTDFVLWKPSDPDQPGWESPWGRGRPGWHLECSAMSETHLGVTFDIHGGGQDLIFPHHENEIAQSVCAHDGAPFAKYWMHNGYLTVDGEKMSKSLGNFYTVRDLLDEGWDGEVIRLALLSAHYRQPLNFSKQALSEAKGQLDRFYRALMDTAQFSVLDETVMTAVLADLEDDINTPSAISRLHVSADAIFRGLKENEPKLQNILERHQRPNFSADDLVDLQNEDWILGHSVSQIMSHKGSLIKSAQLLGLLERDPKEWFKGKTVSVEMTATARANVSISARVIRGENWINEKIQERTEARKRKDFAEADHIRDEMAQNGITLEDKPDGTTDWRRT